MQRHKQYSCEFGYSASYRIAHRQPVVLLDSHMRVRPGHCPDLRDINTG